ncbi:6-phosphofructokinase [Alicyclobacillus hesperidum]|uniref:ATP-dependent 6-phosphofructokinase n=2 Tax=Alicyclobacillus hesperidum TaxID=89784 RepID=A0A1H2V274_9BACL|nr:6-phosphofructokinase [Alicyclobacillus hesperidum]
MSYPHAKASMALYTLPNQFIVEVITMKTFAVLTSGGDAPGMNAAIRSVVRTASFYECRILGIRHGYQGMIDDDVLELTPGSVGDIIQRGGTVLQTARCEAFKTPVGLAKGIATLQKHGIEGLVVIGGDGSFRGAYALAQYGIQVIGIPGTIDNDIPGTDESIGFDTAVNTAVEAIDRIRDTASSHDRTYVVEVMGHRSGAIALSVGMAAGAASILIPEEPQDPDRVLAQLNKARERGKKHPIVIVAEGAACAMDVGEFLRNHIASEVRVTVLGHIQRGGSPSARDRILGGLYGTEAVRLLLEGMTNHMVAMCGARVTAVPFTEVFDRQHEANLFYHRIADILAV